MNGQGRNGRRDDPSSRPSAVALERVLLVIVALSVTLMGAGVVLAAATGRALPHDLTGVSELGIGLARGTPGAYLTLGLVALVAVPVLRVAGSLVVFALERDWRFVLVTGGVLGVMALSVLIGQA